MTLTTPTVAIPVIYRVLVRAQIKTGRLLGLLALGGMGIVLALLSTGESLEDQALVISNFGLGVVAPIGALLIASSTLGDQVDDRTLVYFLLRPVSRFSVAVAAWLAALSVVVPVVGGPLLISALLMGDGGILIGTIVSVALASLAYCAVFLFVGLRLKRAMAFGLSYILIWEGFVANAGSGLARLALRSWTRSLLSEFSDVELTLADRSPGLSVLVCVGVTVAFLALTARRLDRRDIE